MNDKKTDELKRGVLKCVYFLIKIEPFCQHINCGGIDRTIHKVYISSQNMSCRDITQLNAHKEIVFSFKLFKRYIDCFSSMCQLITMAGSNLLDAKSTVG